MPPNRGPQGDAYDAADGIIVHNTVQQIEGLCFPPNEFSLKLLNLYLALLNVANQFLDERRFGF